MHNTKDVYVGERLAGRVWWLADLPRPLTFRWHAYAATGRFIADGFSDTLEDAVTAVKQRVNAISEEAA